MRYIKLFNENNTNLTKEQIDFLNECTVGEWKVNPNTGLIDVQGSFDCNSMNLNDFKGLRFGNVSGSFICNNNNLVTLSGSPREVGENFYSRWNSLKSLEEAPLKIVGFFMLKNIYFTKYNPKSFLEEIKRDLLDVTELLLTHHFLTPQVIKREITKNSYFCYYISRVWNTEVFKKKQDELTQILSQEDLQKIDALWSIGGYL